MGYWYTNSLNLLVTVLKLKSDSCWPLLSRQIFSRAGTMGLMSVPVRGEACWAGEKGGRETHAAGRRAACL